MKRLILLLVMVASLTSGKAQVYQMVVHVNNGTEMGFPDSKIVIPVDNISEVTFEEINKQPQEESIPISFLFKEYTGTTRSPMRRSSAMEDRSFGVFSCYNNGEPLGQETLSVNLMNNQEVAFVDGKWKYLPIKYWPEKAQGDNYASFFAYSPYANDTESSFVSVKSDSDKPLIEYKLVDPMNDAGDLVYGNQINTTKDVDNGCVTIEAKHALAQLMLNVALKENLDANKKVTIKSVTISGQMPYSGQFDLYSEQWINYSDESLSYTIDGDNLSPDLRDAGETAITNQPEGVTLDSKPIGINPLLLIPTDGQKEISITIDYYTTTDTPSLSAGYSRLHNTISKTYNVILKGGMIYTMRIQLDTTSM